MSQQMTLDLLFTATDCKIVDIDDLKLWIENIPERTRVGFRKKNERKQCFVTTFDRHNREALSIVIDIEQSRLKRIITIEDGNVLRTYTETEATDKTLQSVRKWLLSRM